MIKQQQLEKMRESEYKRQKQEERAKLARDKNEEIIKKQKMVNIINDIELLNLL